MKDDMVIELQGVNKIYNKGEANEVVALEGVSLAVKKGQMVAIHGPSGSGKTTLLSIVGCVFSPSSGLATVAGKKVSRLPDHFLTRYRRELVGFVFQNYNLLEHLSVIDNLTLPLLPLGYSPHKRQKKAELLLSKFGISHRVNFPIKKISGGELQRVALARALVNDPPIVVADEPTAHLDSALAMEVMALFESLKNEGKTLVISSHDSRVFQHGAVDRAMAVINGRLLE